MNWFVLGAALCFLAAGVYSAVTGDNPRLIALHFTLSGANFLIATL